MYFTDFFDEDDDDVDILTILIVMINHNNIRNRQYLTRPALVQPKMSAWYRLLNNGDNSSFLEVTGFDFIEFRNLIILICSRNEIRPENRKRGRPSSIDPVEMKFFISTEY